jgi:multidrug efflux pump subunit AcrB
VHVLVDVSKMRSFNLTLEDISNALKSSNLSLVGGTINRAFLDIPLELLQNSEI